MRLAPITRAAETKSRVRSVSTSPRTRREGISHEKRPMSRLSLTTVPLYLVASTSTMKSSGIDSRMSTIRIMKPSIEAAGEPGDRSPQGADHRRDAAEAKKPISSADCPPSMIRPSSSNPCSSVPSR